MKVERLVIGMDFSDPAVAAARWAARVFDDAEIVLVHVVEDAGPGPGALAAARAAAPDRLAELTGGLPHVRVEGVVRSGHPAERIEEVVEERDADLVVVGEHGPHGGLGELLGSTAERLVHTSPVPVLLARSLPAKAPSVILVPIDDSPAAARALEWAGYLGHRFGARVAALHVLDPALASRVRIISGARTAERFEESFTREAREWIEERARAAGLDADRLEPIVAGGSEGHVVVETAMTYGAELIVMGSHGQPPLSQRLLGSVARAALRAAPCSVLVVVERG